MFDIIVFIRFLGLIALVWTNWIGTLIGLFLLFLIQKDDSTAIIKNNTLRNYAVEPIVYIMALMGIWHFPLLDSTLMHVATVIAIVATVCYLVQIAKDEGLI
ncbi:MAG: hypothetical protein KAI57_03895 [Candidatus Pacebacteria bacterium]|nr:hypothetical protein [Candidatus Paceibacterota bacterium]